MAFCKLRGWQIRTTEISSQIPNDFFLWIFFSFSFGNKVCFSLNNQCLVHSWEKAMAPHSSTLAWKVPWMEEPGRLQSMGR